MACEQSGHVAAENIQELAPFYGPSLEMLYPPPYFTVIADGNLWDRVSTRPGPFVHLSARLRVCVRVEHYASSEANSTYAFINTVKFSQVSRTTKRYDDAEVGLQRLVNRIDMSTRKLDTLRAVAATDCT